MDSELKHCGHTNTALIVLSGFKLLGIDYQGSSDISARTIQRVFSSSSDHLLVCVEHVGVRQLVHHCEDWQRSFLSIRRFYSTWLKSFGNYGASFKTNRCH